MMPYEATAPWSTSAISGIYRFSKEFGSSKRQFHFGVIADDLSQMHKTIKKWGMTSTISSYNTAIAALMTWLNYLSAKQSVAKEEYQFY